ncbi:MAG: hypothetical protein Q4C49_03425 [Bacillota bacterium]|nr:hypothetical protein [Bacillota bacterium]
MAQLSRLKKNQELREKIDLETVITNPNEIPNSNQSINTSSHAKKNVHPHKQSSAINQSATSTSPVIDDLLAEVKKYNMENGDRVSSDTQINILQSLDTKEESPKLRRNNHILPMDEEEERLGSTMKLPRTSLESLQPDNELFRFSKLTKINRVSPVEEEAPQEDTKETKLEEPVKEEISSVLVKPARIEFSEPVIIDSSDLIESFSDDLEEGEDFVDDMEEDHLEIVEFMLNRSNEEDVNVVENLEDKEEGSFKKKFKFFKKKNKKEKVKVEEEEEVEEVVVPLVQEPTIIEEPKEEQPIEEEVQDKIIESSEVQPEMEETDEEEVSIVKVDAGEDDIVMLRNNEEEEVFEEDEKKSNVLNIILVILLLALLACAIYVFFLITNMG